MSCARKIVTRSPHRRVGRVACPWFQAVAIEYESLLERDFVRLALLDPKLFSISHQPFSLDLGELGTYIPDFLLIGQDGKLVVEVKPAIHVGSARNKPRLAHAKDVLQDQGYRFVVATEKNIHQQGRHRRAGILLRHARCQIEPAVADRVERIASSYSDGIEILNLASKASATIQTVLHLVGRRRLSINRMLRLGELDLVYPIGAGHVTL